MFSTNKRRVSYKATEKQSKEAMEGMRKKKKTPVQKKQELGVMTEHLKVQHLRGRGRKIASNSRQQEMKVAALKEQQNCEGGI